MNIGVRFFVPVFFLVAFLVCIMPVTVFAATWYVHSSSGNDTTGNGSSGSPYKTFHKAYTSASAGDVIDLTGTFTWTDADETGDAVTSGYTIGKNLTIRGQGADETVIQSATASTTGDRRVFTVSNGINATFDKLNIRYGRPLSTNYGGGIYNSGTTTITNSDINNNSSPAYGGGGIANYGIIDIASSSIRDNTGLYGGGGIRSLDSAAHTYLTNVTVTGNMQTSSSAYTDGGGIDIRFGALTMTNSTVMYNTAYGTAGVCVCDTTATLTIKNSIIANNNVRSTPTDVDFEKQGTVNDNGYNIVGNSSGHTWAVTGDWTDTNLDGTFSLYTVGTTGQLKVESLPGTNDNPVGTYTHLTYSGSISIDNGGTGSNGATSTVPSIDQRGAARSGSTDIGAFEYNGTGLSISEPTTQASSITFSTVEYNRMTINWTAGDGTRHIVFMKAGSSGTASPVDGTAYATSSAFGFGDQIGSSGWYAVYEGLAASTTVTGLSEGVDYRVHVITYNGITDGTQNYLTSSATDNPATQQTHDVVTIYANSSTGNDTTGDGSSGSPYKTFHKAYTSASAGDTINLSGTFTWTDTDETGDAATSGYTLNKDLTIEGTSADETIIQTATASTTGDRRVFTLPSYVNISMEDLMIRHGRVTGSVYGGGLYVTATSSLILNNVDINNNSSPSYGGGGIALLGGLTMTNSSVRNNLGYYGGGGIRMIDMMARATITNSTISFNDQNSSSAYTDGGGIDMRWGHATITNSTFTGNSAYGTSGICVCDSAAILAIRNTIIASSTKKGGGAATDFEKIGTVNDGGYNIIGSSSGHTWTGTGDWTDTNTDGTYSLYSIGTTGQLYLDSTLGLNSSLYDTYTHAITSASSIAVNNATTTAHGSITIPTTDQRGATRSSNTDIGAYEYGGGFTDSSAPSVSITAPSSGGTVSGATVSVTASASDNVSVAGVSFYIDGTLQGSEDTTSTYGITWDSTATSSGTHSVFAVARDTSNNYATSSSVSFSVDNTSPSVLYFNPADNATDVGVTSTFEIAFSEAMATSSGSFVVKKMSDNSTVESFAVTSSFITASSTTAFVIDPSVTLESGTQYYIQIDATALDDTQGNSYAGISDTTTWNFTTAGSAEEDEQATTTSSAVSTSASSQVSNLISNGNFSLAISLIEKYPHLLLQPSTFTMLSQLLAQLQAQQTAQNTSLSSLTSVSNISRDLKKDDEGDDVVRLQQFLIEQKKGPAALELARVGVTGYFGEYTKNALGEFQKAVGVVPYQGYFGPRTKLYIKHGGY